MIKLFRVNISVKTVCMIVSIALLPACASMQQAESKKDAEVHYRLGVSYLKGNETQKAFVKFHEAIRLNPRDKRSFNYLGLISAQRQEYDKAISYYKRAIAIDKNYSEAMNNLGVTYLETENWEEAIKYFREALKNPLYATPEKAHANLGYAQYRKGNYEEAEYVLQTALLKYPRSNYSAYVLGLVYTALEKMDDAIEIFDTAVNMAPYDLEARWELAHAYLRVGRNKKALEQFQIIAETSGSKRSTEASKYIELLSNP
ncbi:tetratricopeptide repeat protein [bacterium]|nr:MAG: tetratricopeptide repeat protein [bacterium]